MGVTVQIGPSPQQVYRLLTKLKIRGKIEAHPTPQERETSDTMWRVELHNGNTYLLLKDEEGWHISWAVLGLWKNSTTRRSQ